MAFESLNVSMRASETISRSLRSVSSAASKAGRAASSANVQFGSYAEALDETSGEAMMAVFANNRVASSIDEVADQAREAVGNLAAYSSAVSASAAAGLGASNSLGIMNSRLARLTVLAAAAAPLVGGLVTSLGGLATAAGTAGVGIGALAFGGLQAKAEQMAAASSEFKNSSEAMSAIFSNFTDRLKEATEPLQTVANTEFVMAGLNNTIELVEMFSASVVRLAPLLRSLASVFGSRVMTAAPDIFAELEQTVIALAPALKGMTEFIQDLPGLIAFMRSEAVQLDDELASFTGSLLRAAGALSDFGSNLLTIVLPPLSLMLDLMTVMFNVLSAIPTPVLAAASVFTVATVAMAAFSAASWSALGAVIPLSGALLALASAISWPIVLAGALIGAIAGVITYFGLWNDIVNAGIALWNGFVGALEWGLENIMMVTDLLDDLLGPLLMLVPVLGPIIWAFENWGKIMETVGGVLSWLGGLAAQVGEYVMGLVDKMLAALNAARQEAIKLAETIPGVNIDMGEIEKNADLGSLKVEKSTSKDKTPGKSGPGRGKERPPRGATVQQTTKKTENNYDFTGSDFSGTDETAVQRRVEEAVKAANKEDRTREEGSEF